MSIRDAELLLDVLHTAQTALYASGDARLLDPGIVWRIPGHNLIAGTYQGVEEVIGYMLRRRELANATFRMHRREVLVGPSHFAALTDGTVERHGVRHEWSTIGLYRARNGLIVECTLIPWTRKPSTLPGSERRSPMRSRSSASHVATVSTRSGS